VAYNFLTFIHVSLKHFDRILLKGMPKGPQFISDNLSTILNHRL